MTSLVPGTSINSSANSVKKKLEKKVADFLGYTTDSSKWSDIQKERLDSIVDKGYAEYLYPPRVRPEDEPHRWGFLRANHTFKTVAGTYEYDLPQDLAYISSSVTFEGQPKFYETYIRLAGWADIKIYRTSSSATSDGLPCYYAIDMSLSNSPGSEGTEAVDNFWYYENTAGSLPAGSSGENTEYLTGYNYPVHLTAEHAAFYDYSQGGDGEYEVVAFAAYPGLVFYMPKTGATKKAAGAEPSGVFPYAGDAGVIPSGYITLKGYLENTAYFADQLVGDDPRTDSGTSSGKLALYPTPDKEYQIIFQYQKGASGFSATPLGPNEFHVLLEECVLSHAEKEMNDMYGIHRQSYMELLDRFIEHDKRMYPEEMLSLGQMRQTPLLNQHGQYSSISDPRAFSNQFAISHVNQVS